MNPEKPRGPKVAILLCTFHGEKFLSEQLDSIAAQTHGNWEVWASDDGSSDATHRILLQYQTLWGKERLSIHSGPQEGFVANFLALVTHADIEADFYAYSDQDDIWERDKLERAVAFLSTVSTDIPGLYCSRTRVVNAENNTISFSPDYSRPPSFQNALSQNIASGNTMVFNHATRALLMRVESTSKVVYHDWVTYLLVTGCGGRVYFDKLPSVRYRQHGDNHLGANLGLLPTVYRFFLMLRGRFQGWNAHNIRILHGFQDLLTEESRRALQQFDQARNAGLKDRIARFRQSGVHRQTALGNIGLFLAVLLRRI